MILIASSTVDPPPLIFLRRLDSSIPSLRAIARMLSPVRCLYSSSNMAPRVAREKVSVKSFFLLTDGPEYARIPVMEGFPMLRGLLQTLIIISGFIAFGLAAAWIFAASPCQSGWCPTYKCYGSGGCGPQCICLSRDFSGGVCVDLQQGQALTADGWTVLP